MQTPDGRKIYDTATNTLTPGENFDVEVHGIYGVLKEYLYRGYKNGWTDLASGLNIIPYEIYEPITECKNLATQYGEISIKIIREIENTKVNTPTRAVKYCHMMYK